MVDSEELENPGPESINFVVAPDRTEHVVDFEKPLYLIEIEYSNNITQHIVNADSAEEARDAALVKAASEGEKVLTASRYVVTFLEQLPKREESRNGA